jgi:hypothetical protein
MNDLGKPGAGESHARFDEGRLETEPRSRDRSACKEVRGQRRTNSATAPVSYSTPVNSFAAGDQSRLVASSMRFPQGSSR